jgi:hypothetical protein
VENPELSFKWRGWYTEWNALKSGARSLYEFGRSELRRRR